MQIDEKDYQSWLVQLESSCVDALYQDYQPRLDALREYRLEPYNVIKRDAYRFQELCIQRYQASRGWVNYSNTPWYTF